MGSVESFAAAHPEADVLVLNTGGPPAAEFADVSVPEWQKYHNQLFLGMCVLLQRVRVRDGGYLFLVSSSVVREPSARLVVSGAYRSAMSSVLKVLSREWAPRGVSVINIAPGPVNTGRLAELVGDVAEFARGQPMGRVAEPAEVGALVASIVSGGIRCLSGQVLVLDGAASAAV
ncbi:MAG: SDR family oxidoreductase [Thaumarchaeota archaeon]|nr:SDR family oxidoreductase [Nitrososphaerota archaeon]MDD9808411.1 SDR family oxidoreductase [Nitrososphaerota archaeon]MDD9813933.1 SDR family oxidoreductase [Nitrososphaerota archaeon]MDD9825909.1 SDR family oxidoreductase [Nitrososphaerota archaeon]MDD9843728.1 SDR family oxidoreductase [Nitrososphaerota archaeon]